MHPIPSGIAAGVASRQVDWGTVDPNGIYLVTALAAVIFGWGVYRRWRQWRKGQPIRENRTRPIAARIRMLLRHSLGQSRLWVDPWPAVVHLSVVWGMMFLFAASLVDFIQHDLHIPIAQGPFYLYFQSLFINSAGFVATVAIGVLAYRRLVLRPERLTLPATSRYRRGDGWNLLWLFVIMVSGYVLSGMRIAATQDPYGIYRPFGDLVASVFEALRISPLALLRAHQVFWWVHGVMALSWLAVIPYWKSFHMFVGAANNYMRPLDPTQPLLNLLDVEAAPTLGVARLADFTWKDLLDLDACTECGLCQSACPAYATQKPLSPKGVIVQLRDHMHQARGPWDSDTSPLLVAGLIAPETLWACTTCRACVDACPVGIEQFPKLVDMRRYQVMEATAVPDTMALALRSLETRGHPYPGTSRGRLDWAQGLDIPVLGEDSGSLPVAWVLWVGCNAAFNERQQRMIQALARVLQRAGVAFAILGDAERCTGDPARRMGNEFLFQELARDNIALLQRHQVRKLVTLCPHCLNVLKNDYRSLGLEIEVVHHTQLLAELLAQGALTVQASALEAVTYHDPCYLGRYNHIFEDPRKVLMELLQAPLREMPRSRQQSFCCGGGGGLSWMDDKTGLAINRVRAQEALRTGASVLAAACPFCMTMLEDGVKAEKTSEQIMDVLDVCELVEKATRVPTP